MRRPGTDGYEVDVVDTGRLSELVQTARQGDHLAVVAQLVETTPRNADIHCLASAKDRADLTQALEGGLVSHV